MMWRLPVTLLLLAASTPFIGAEDQDCTRNFHEIQTSSSVITSIKPQTCSTRYYSHTLFNCFYKDCERILFVDIQNISAISPTAFGTAASFTSVELISSAQECNMVELAQESFQNYTDLHYLTLDCVKFTPTSNSSNTIKSLRELKLSRTEWSNNTKDFFSSHPAAFVQILRVKIRNLTPDTFSENYMQSLVLKFNNLKIIENYSFQRFHNLEQLTISNNDIHHLNSEMFSGLKKLSRFDLSDNAIAVMRSNTFEALTNLNMLSLSYNQLRSLPKYGIFRNLTNLESVYLGYNS